MSLAGCLFTGCCWLSLYWLSASVTRSLQFSSLPLFFSAVLWLPGHFLCSSCPLAGCPLALLSFARPTIHTSSSRLLRIAAGTRAPTYIATTPSAQQQGAACNSASIIHHRSVHQHIHYARMGLISVAIIGAASMQRLSAMHQCSSSHQHRPVQWGAAFISAAFINAYIMQG